MRLISVVFFISCFMLSLNAQDKPEGKNRNKMKARMEAQKIAFFTQELDLSSEEAQNFWPVYNQYYKEMETLKKDRRKDRDVVLSDAEASAELENMIKIERQHIDIKEKYISKLKNVLPVQKVAKLYRLEHRFKREMLNKLGKSRKKRMMKAEKRN